MLREALQLRLPWKDPHVGVRTHPRHMPFLLQLLPGRSEVTEQNASLGVITTLFMLSQGSWCELPLKIPARGVLLLLCSCTGQTPRKALGMNWVHEHLPLILGR